MASTVIAYPHGPAAVYRPMRLHVQRQDPSDSEVFSIKIADASDVSIIGPTFDYGQALQMGDVLVKHTTIQGAVPAAEGRSVYFGDGCGQYTGKVAEIKGGCSSGTLYMTIDLNLGAATLGTSPPTPSLRMVLPNYTVLTKVLVYTDPAGAPQEVVLRGQPIDDAGNTYIDVGVVVRDYFSTDISRFLTAPVSPAQSAHGITALFYRLHVVEVYDDPEVDMSDPFDGTHDVAVDDIDDDATWRVAVNAVHPYASPVVDWSSSDLGAFVIGSASPVRKFLTTAPRADVKIGNAVVVGSDGIIPGPRLTASPGDIMWAAMLLGVDDGYTTACQLAVVSLDTSTPTVVGTVTIGAGDPCAAIAVGIGPANLGALVSGLSKYSVILRAGISTLSEPIEVTVDRKSREGMRPFAWMNKLGGVDAHTFTGREIYTSKVKRATVRKPYGAGQGYDWTERTYRAEPERTRTVSTAPLPVEYRRWLAEDLGESANVVTVEHGRPVPVVLLTDELQGGDTRPVGHRPLTVDYRMGVDNLSQQA